MIWLKSCPRCKQGDMNLDGDDSLRCLQCGYVHYAAGDSSLAYRLAQLLGTD